MLNQKKSKRHTKFIQYFRKWAGLNASDRLVKLRSDYWKWFEVKEGTMLIQVLKYVPQDKGELTGKILLPSKIQGGAYVSSEIAIDSKMVALGYVIKVSKEAQEQGYAPGDIVQLPTDIVEKESWNQEFIHAMQTYAKKGSGDGAAALAHIPDDMERRTRNIDNAWMRYKVHNYFDARENEQERVDQETYCLPLTFINGKVQTDQIG